MQCIIVDCFNAYIWEIFIGTREVVRQACNRILYQIEGSSFGISRMLKTSHKVLSSHISILFTIRSIPFNSLTDFISISQTILRDRPIFSYWRDKITIFVRFHKSIYTISYSNFCRSCIWSDVIQWFWIWIINITISRSTSTWLRRTSR